MPTYTTTVRMPNRIKTLKRVVMPVVAAAGSSAGTINVYLDGALNQTIVSANLNAEIINISL